MEPQDVEREDAVVCEVRCEPRAPLLERFDQPRQRLLAGARVARADSVPPRGAVDTPAVVPVAEQPQLVEQTVLFVGFRIPERGKQNPESGAVHMSP